MKVHRDESIGFFVYKRFEKNTIICARQEVGLATIDLATTNLFGFEAKL